uniref:Acyl-CoA dehydrogenase n=1 Tax=OCS116 cluster bacterium TaxID=2030921 RepID=A0A2A4Z1B3_9PROT
MSILEIFMPSEDVAMIGDVARRWLDDVYVSAPNGFDADKWSEMAKMGWQGILAPEGQGGSGLAVGTGLMLAHEMGRALVVEPFVSSAIVGVGLALGMEDLLCGLADGARIAGIAGLFGGITAEPSSEGFRLRGTARFVMGGAELTDILVIARLPDDCEAIFCLQANAPGLIRNDYTSVDNRRLCNLKFDDVAIGSIIPGPIEGRSVLIAKARAVHNAALAFEAVGAMDHCNEITRQYLNERKQFEKPLASFQALGHKVAEMYADTELARTMAAMIITPDGTPASSELEARALALITLVSRTLGERAIQLHGGMGMTEEMEVGRYFKRLLYLSSMMGGETVPRHRIIEDLLADAESVQKDKS